MIRVITFAIIVTVLFLMPVSSTVSAQISKSIDLDEISATYSQGDRIIIAGSVVNIVGLGEVTIKVTRDDVFVTADQLDIALDGTFATILNTNGGVWMAGAHLVTVTHTDGTRSSLSFDLRGSGGVQTEDIFTVDTGNGDTVDVGYAISGGSIDEMDISQDVLSMVVRILPDTAGSLTLDINREYLDAKSNICSGGDEDFIVLVDNVEVPYKTLGTDAIVRTIEIAFEAEERKIQIIGTCAIPEFGALSLLVLAAATGGIVAASRRFAI